jgi:pimeloyl-ACP methyl ester carboxylesterase
MVLADTVAGVVDAELAELLARHGSAHVDLLRRVLSAGFIARSPELAFLYAQVEALNHVHGAPIKLQTQGPDREKLKACKARTLLIVGDEDKLSPPQAVEWLSRQLPSARMEVIANAGHSAYFERPEEFNRLVLAFLDEAR